MSKVTGLTCFSQLCVMFWGSGGLFKSNGAHILLILYIYYMKCKKKASVQDTVLEPRHGRLMRLI